MLTAARRTREPVGATTRDAIARRLQDFGVTSLLKETLKEQEEPYP